MRRSTVLSLTLRLVFPGEGFLVSCKEKGKRDFDGGYIYKSRKAQKANADILKTPYDNLTSLSLCIYFYGSRSHSSFIEGSHTTKNTASVL
jgi:hypothetical protein